MDSLYYWVQYIQDIEKYTIIKIMKAQHNNYHIHAQGNQFHILLSPRTVTSNQNFIRSSLLCFQKSAAKTMMNNYGIVSCYGRNHF